MACQAIVHASVDVKALGCDFYVFSGHKLYGPTGIGVLYGRKDMLNAMPPYQGGGDMIDHVAFEKTTFKNAPARFEAGTPAFVEAIGLAAAIDYLQSLDRTQVGQHEDELYQSAYVRLKAMPGIKIYGEAANRGSILCFTCDWGHASDVAMIMDKQGIAVRAGHHCAMPLMKELGVTANDPRLDRPLYDFGRYRRVAGGPS
jgi:cysteine desulfurase/selenocysteine lyase